MTDQRVDYLVIGGGLAAAHGAIGVRERDRQGSVLVVSEEDFPLYERPPLSKDYLRGEKAAEKLMAKPPEYYRENAIEVRLGTRAVRVDGGRRTVTLEPGGDVQFGRLLLGTGSRLRRLDLPGGDLPNVHYLRRKEDSDAIREAARNARRAAVIGGGFIGAEVAASLRQLGLEVTLTMLQDTLWAHLFGEQVGGFFHGTLEQHGVRILHAGARRILGDGRAGAVELTTDEAVDCDIVVIGVGVTPDLELARQAACRIEDGVVVDEYLETSVAGIYAAGDIARFPSPLYGPIRVEHWDVAINTSKTSGRNMAGAGERYTAVPYFFSDLFDVAMEFVGHRTGSEEVFVRGELSIPPFAVFYLEGDRLRAAVIVNDFDFTEKVKQAVAEARRVKDLPALMDPNAELARALAA